MAGNKDKSNKFEKLRKHAEVLIRQQTDDFSETPSDMMTLIHELRIHQVEMEIQNEELKRSQHELSDLHQEYENLYEFAPCGYITLNAAGIITRANLTGVSLLGTARQYLLHSGFTSYICPGWENTFLTARKKAGETGEKQSIELPLKRENGSPAWVRADIMADFDKTGALIQWRIVLADITAQRKAEEDKIRIEDQLKQAQKLESIGILAGGLAHDFNNILSVIMGNIELAKADIKPDSGITVFLKRAEKALFQARDLTRQLITFSKGGAPVKKTGPIGALVTDTANEALSGSNVTVQCTVAQNLWMVDFGEDQIKLALKCLLANAAEAMPDGGLIEIRAENFDNRSKTAEKTVPLSEGRYVKISIRDQGVGIPKENLSKLFVPYFSTKQKGAQKGLGLGLATTYSIITQHDGYIFVESEVGVGTTFLLFFPAHEKKIREAESQRSASPEKSAIRTDKILLMDDELMIRHLGQEILTRLGYVVAVSRNGDEAVELYQHATASGKPFDAVILDLIVKGGMGGKEAAKKIFAINPQAKIIVSSGYSDDPVMTDCNKYGFTGALAKPYRIEDLSGLLNKILQE